MKVSQPVYSFQIELQFEWGYRCRQGKVGQVIRNNAEGFTAEDSPGKAVKDSNVMRGVSRREDYSELSLPQMDYLTVVCHVYLIAWDGKDRAEGGLEIFAEDQSGIVDEFGRLRHVLCSLWMEHDFGVG